MAALNPFASSNPTIDALFLRAFAQDQADRAAAEAASGRGVQREQIGAQYKLAEAQQQSNAEQQRMNNLFRMADLNQRQQTEAERNRLYARGLDIQEASTKPKTVEQQRKDDITTTNAAAKAAALKWQDAYDAIVEAQLDKAATPGSLNFWGNKETYRTELEKPDNPQRKAIEDNAWNTIIGQMRGDKSGSPQLVIPDFRTRKFNPVQYDDRGNLIPPGATQQPPPKQPPPGGASTNAPPSTNAAGFRVVSPSELPVVDLTPTERVVVPQETPPAMPVDVGYLPNVLDRFLRQYGAPATTPAGTNAPAIDTTPDTFGILKPTRLITVPIDTNNALQMSEADAAEVERQLRSVPVEQRRVTAAAMRDQLMKAGRARLVPRSVNDYSQPYQPRPEDTRLEIP